MYIYVYNSGEYIATGSLGGNVSIWSLSKGEPVRIYNYISIIYIY